MSQQITINIDDDLRQDVLQVLEKAGITEEEAIRRYYQTISRNQTVPLGKVKRDEEYMKSLPVSKNIPNAETIVALEESRDYTQLKTYNNFQEVLDELDDIEDDEEC